MGTDILKGCLRKPPGRRKPQSKEQEETGSSGQKEGELPTVRGQSGDCEEAQSWKGRL